MPCGKRQEMVRMTDKQAKLKLPPRWLNSGHGCQHHMGVQVVF